MNATTTLLQSIESVDAAPLERLMPLIYDELSRMARRQLAREHGNATLQTTELVHEAYLRLVDDTQVTRKGRAYFFGAAARAMRQVLVDAARRRGAAKRGGREAPVTLKDHHVAVDAYAAELVDLDAALTELEKRSPRQVRVVECRFFGGLSVEETAAALDVSARTVKSDWALARAWLFDILRGTDG
jgi:RNA polymerase sigma factor (TIGR02999 family)